MVKVRSHMFNAVSHWSFHIQSGPHVWGIFRWWGDTKPQDIPHLMPTQNGEMMYVYHFEFESLANATEAMAMFENPRLKLNGSRISVYLQEES